MKTTILILLVLLVFCSCRNEEPKLEFPIDNQPNIKVTVNEVSIFVTIDSLKSIVSNIDTSKIPEFLSDKLLDAKYPIKTDHGIFSCRKMVISSINDKSVLNKIISLDKFKGTLSEEEIKTNNLQSVPGIKQSVQDLARERLDELER